jgi:uncharacterized membrane protein
VVVHAWADNLRQSTSARVVGIDVARCLALLGMMAAHMLPDDRWQHEVSAGRASALFAVLAGVSLALMTGGDRRHRGPRLVAGALGLEARAIIIAGIGLWLGTLDTNVAVILTYYGVLFILGLPFLGLSARGLATLAGLWCIAAPVLSHLLRQLVADTGPIVPTTSDLEQVWPLVTNLTLTGYYPAFPWLAYLFAGMALGRLDLRREATAVWVAVTGAALTVAAKVASAALLATDAARAALTASPDTSGATWTEVRASLDRSYYGTTPEDTAWWLAVAEPHTGTPFDLAHTTGTALLVVGLAILATRWATRAWAIVFGAGAMTLTLYSAHVVMLTPDVPPPDGPQYYRTQVFIVLGIGAAFAAARLRGPLELLVRLVSGTVSRWANRVVEPEPTAPVRR